VPQRPADPISIRGAPKTFVQLPTRRHLRTPSAHAATSGQSPELPDFSPEVDSPRS